MSGSLFENMMTTALAAGEVHPLDIFPNLSTLEA